MAKTFHALEIRILVDYVVAYTFGEKARFQIQIFIFVQIDLKLEL